MSNIPIENLGSLWEPPAYGIRRRGGDSDWVVCGRCGSFVSDSNTHTKEHQRQDELDTRILLLIAKCGPTPF